MSSSIGEHLAFPKSLDSLRIVVKDLEDTTLGGRWLAAVYKTAIKTLMPKEVKIGSIRRMLARAADTGHSN